jgi:hypothetical protein
MAALAQLFQLIFGFRTACVQVAGDVLANTFTDTGDLVTDNDHGLVDGMQVIFKTLVTTTGIAINTYYFVISATTNTFQVALTAGGAAIALTTNGTGTYQARYDVRLRKANKITNSVETKEASYEGDDEIEKITKSLGLSFQFDADCLPLGAYQRIFGLTAITANLPDGYTSATPLLTAAERSGVQVGFWGEGDVIEETAAGTRIDKTGRAWYPQGKFVAVSAPDRTTGDKAAVSAYKFTASMDPTVDVLGMPLPTGLTGSPCIWLDKAA